MDSIIILPNTQYSKFKKLVSTNIVPNEKRDCRKEEPEIAMRKDQDTQDNVHLEKNLSVNLIAVLQKATRVRPKLNEVHQQDPSVVLLIN